MQERSGASLSAHESGSSAQCMITKLGDSQQYIYTVASLHSQMALLDSTNYQLDNVKESNIYEMNNNEYQPTGAFSN